MAKDVLTAEEVAQAIGELTKAELNRLSRIAGHYAVGVGVEAQDVVNEAARRALDGTRACPRGVSLVTFLVNTMRSIAHAERIKLKEAPVNVSLSSPAEEDGATPDAADGARGAEDLLVAKEDAAARLAALDGLFAGDDDAQLVVMGLLDDLTADEIRSLGEWDEQGYATVRRRMRRKIERRYPQGWTR